MSISGLIFVIFFVAFVISVIVYNAARVFYFFKCFWVKQCSNKNCHYKGFCEKYNEMWTKEDMEIIQKLIEELE